MVSIKDFLKSPGNAVIIRSDIKIDIAPLKEFFLSRVRNIKKTYQFDNITGGWSIQSADGTVGDGWQRASNAFKFIDGKYQYDQEWVDKQFTNVDVKDLFKDYHKPTEICHGPAEELLRTLENIGIKSKRSRFIELEKERRIGWHVDGPKLPKWRGHISVITNPGATFQYTMDNGHSHIGMNIPADGHIYFVRIDKMHRVVNEGNEHRVHVIFDQLSNLSDADFKVEPVLSFDQPI